jgi:hypothetical protein
MADSQIAGNIIQILAGLPEFLRKPMLKSRLSEFFTLPDEDKRETITNALNASLTIDFVVLSRLIKTWMEVLCEFDEEKRRSMFSAYIDVIADSPDRLSKLNIEGLISIFTMMPENNKQLLAGSLHNLVQNLQHDKKAKFLAAVPENAKNILKL